MSGHGQAFRGAAAARIRLAVPRDRPLVARFLSGLGTESRYQRHFEHGTAPDEALLRRLDAGDFREGLQLVAVSGQGGREVVVAHAECVRVDSAAEIALVVADERQGQGLGARLMEQLEVWAQGWDLARIYGEVMATNQAMLALARRCGFKIRHGPDARVLVIDKDLGVQSCAPEAMHQERAYTGSAVPA
ncbi:MAG: GNAT family N-acetyltransferase [Proteobacteria bacterium]|nr:GNAT family N-acetyltransferase [Pseudomonadota bacterium]